MKQFLILEQPHINKFELRVCLIIPLVLNLQCYNLYHYLVIMGDEECLFEVGDGFTGEGYDGGERGSVEEEGCEEGMVDRVLGFEVVYGDSCKFMFDMRF